PCLPRRKTTLAPVTWRHFLRRRLLASAGPLPPRPREIDQSQIQATPSAADRLRSSPRSAHLPNHASGSAPASHFLAHVDQVRSRPRSRRRHVGRSPSARRDTAIPLPPSRCASLSCHPILKSRLPAFLQGRPLIFPTLDRTHPDRYYPTRTRPSA